MNSQYSMLKKQKKATLFEISKKTFDALSELHPLIYGDNKAIDGSYYPEAQDKMNEIVEKLEKDIGNIILKILKNEK